MELRGFSFEKYDEFLGRAVEEGYETRTVAEYIAEDDPPEPYLILRHDVDRLVDNAVEMARLEAARGIEATYYFRTSTFDPAVVEAVRSLGHEVGYHYEDFVRAGGDVDIAHELFADTLASFRDHVPIRTVCAHGNPLSPYTNYNMWDGGPSPESYDLLGEAYLSIEKDPDVPDTPYYCTDTGREWTVKDPAYDDVTSTDELISLLGVVSDPGVYLLAHPSRWSHTYSAFATSVSLDLVAAVGKRSVATIHRAQERASSAPGIDRVTSGASALTQRFPGFR